MYLKDIEKQFDSINVWKRNGRRAPNKPLLLLLALGWVYSGQDRLQPYEKVDRELGKLLREFGPPRKHPHTEYPFCRLPNDGLWELTNTAGLGTRASNTDIKKSELLRGNVHGGFPLNIFNYLRSNPSTIQSLAINLLESQFTDSYDEGILQSVGLDFQTDIVIRRRRNPKFRDNVLRAYEYRCAVCGADVRLGDQFLALEAAHIKWHQALGPDTVNNGLALCVLHHKLFDRGAFTVCQNSFEVRVSEDVQGGASTYDWLFRHHGNVLNQAIRTEYFPNPDFLVWHQEEVFRGPERERNLGIVAEPE